MLENRPNDQCEVRCASGNVYYRTPDFVNGQFVALDDIFDLAPSDRFLVAVWPLGGPFSGHRAGFWAENLFFAIGPWILSMVRL